MSRSGERFPVFEFSVDRFGFDPNGNDVNATPWARLMTYIQAQVEAGRTSGIRGVKIIFPRGDYCLNNVSFTPTLPWYGKIIVEGQGDQTRIFPGGGQGQALTLDATGWGGSIVVRDIRLGYGPELTSPNLAYSQPMLTVRAPGAWAIEGVTGLTTGTGTFVLLDVAFNGTMQRCLFNTGSYAVPVVWTDSTNTQPDTISWRDCVFQGQYGLFMNYTGPMLTPRFDEAKFVSGTANVTSAESFLAVASAAGASTVTLNAGDGAKFAVNDSITVGEPHTPTGGYGIEANKVTAINVDTLTLLWPLQYSHDPAAHHVQVLRGGVGLALCDGARNALFTGSHFEHYNVGVMAWTATSPEFDACTFTSLSAIRICNIVTDLMVGPVESSGANIAAGGTSNIVVDIPSWVAATGAQAPVRPMIDGPISNTQGIALTVNINGTSYGIDEFGYIAPTLTASFTAVSWGTPAVKLGRNGLQFRGLAQFAGVVAQGTVIFTLPAEWTPPHNKLLTNWQSNAQSTTAVPVLGTLEVVGADQGGNAGQVRMNVASTAAGYLSLDSVADLTIH